MDASTSATTPATAAQALTGHGAPLHGIRVLDLTRLLPGPVCTLHLADLGADVIKIEDMEAGDYTAAAVRRLANRNKRGLRLDLKQAAGRDTLLRLADSADVLVESFRPGVMDRLGVGYAALAARNPRLVYCSLTGYGQTGPWRDAAGHDMNYAGWTGVADQIATPTDTDSASGAAPALSNLPVADLLGGSLTAAMGILAALVDVARTGRGRHVDIAIADGVLAHALLPLAAVNSEGRTAAVGQGKLTGALPCYAVYATADGRHLAVGALERKFWDRFCTALGRPDLQALHQPADAAVRAQVFATLRSLIAAHDLAHWRAVFAEVDCCVTPILKLEESLELAQFRARGMVLADGQGGHQLGCPVRMSGFDFQVRHPAPHPGQHTDAILAEAGLGQEQIQALRAQAAAG